MKKDYPQLESLSDFSISDNTKVIKDIVTVALRKESVVNIAEIKAKVWSIKGITSSGDGNIVITGGASKWYSHITVVNRKGEVQRQDLIENDTSKSFVWRYCCPLSEFKVITTCKSDIGIYDVRDGAYSKKNICGVITSWPPDQYVSCVTTDPVKSHIIVGTNSRHVYVFTDQLNYSHMLTLPDVIDGAFDITVHRGCLLVCCNGSDRAYAVTLEESDSYLMYEFTKPDFDVYDCSLHSVCTDKNEFIYMLWVDDSGRSDRCILVQYSQDGRHLLTKRIVYENVRCVTPLEEDGSEKLVLATYRSGKLYTYGLIVTKT